METSLLIQVHEISVKTGDAGELLSLLNSIKGLSANIKEGGNSVNNCISIKVIYDLNEIQRTQNRYAGRKRKYINENPEHVIIEDIKNMIKNDGSKAVAKRYGVDASTIYRRIKQAEKSGKNYIEV